MRDLFDDLVGAPDDVRWNNQVKRFGNLQIDNQFDFSGLLNGQFGWFLTSQNSTSIAARNTMSFSNTGSIAHQTTNQRILANRIDSRHLSPRSCFNKVLPLTCKKRIGADDNSPRTLLNQFVKRDGYCYFVTGLDDEQLSPNPCGSCQNIICIVLSVRIGTIQQEADWARLRYAFVNNLKLFSQERIGEEAYPGNIAARTIETGNQT